MHAGFGSNPTAAQTGYKARSLSSAFIHACMNSHGAVRSKRYHVIKMFTYMSGIIAPVNKSTIGYFKSVTVVRVSFRLPVIAVLPSEGVSHLGGPTP